MNEATQNSVWWGKALMIAGVIAALCLPIGALGSRFGLWDFQLGFLLLLAGAVLGAIALFGGLIGLLVANKKGLSGERSRVVAGMVLGVIVIGVMGMQVSAGTSVPPIHNISTDVSDPPQFAQVVALRGDESNPLEYTEEVAVEQQAAYPDVVPLVLNEPVAAVFARVAGVLEGLNLEVVNADPSASIVEATFTSFWFGFKDDVVVRVKPHAQGSVVDVRSVSRVGQSDLGANAARIRAILAALQG